MTQVDRRAVRHLNQFPSFSFTQLLMSGSLINLLTFAGSVNAPADHQAELPIVSPGPHLRERWLSQAVGAGGVTTAL